MISKRKFCIKNILKQNVKCENPKVTWIVPESDCLTTPCEGCNDECIEISLLEGCKHNKIKVIVECPDCDDCPPVIDEITFCTGDDECDKCDHCDEGICKPKCEEYCDDNGNCVECVPGTCEDGRECIDGKCICPPSKVEVDGICYDCMEDSHCGPCEICKQGKCVAKECFKGVCDPNTEECVDCLNSGDCEENEQCVENECLCAPGFIYEPGIGCVPSPECIKDEDCGDCYICTEDGCKERKCPEGTVCYKDECVSLCDCSNPFCTGVDRNCIEIRPDTCACIKGDKDPCNDKPCLNGEDCGEGCGCDDGRCVSCESLDCNKCPDVLGCGCEGDNCNDISGKCRGTCTHGSDCGPGCGCRYGKCVPCSSFGCDSCDQVEGCGCKGDKCEDLNEGCFDSFKINKSDSRCALEARLITTDKCQCNRVTVSSEVSEYNNAGARFKLQLKDGDADVSGLMNIPFLRDTGITNYAPSSGRVNVKVIQRGGGTGFGETIYDQDYNFSGTDTIETDLLPVIPEEGVTGIDVVFTVPKKSLKFDSGCSFSEEEEKIVYKLNSVGRNGFIKYEDLDSPNVKFKVLESADSRTPIFTWFATSQGAEDQVRSVYARRESEGVYVDGWNSFYEGIRIGHYYRVESDCACDKETNLTCPSTTTSELLTFCNPKDLTDKLVYTLSNCYKTITFDPVLNMFDICDSSARSRQPFSLYFNGSDQRSGFFVADPSTNKIVIGGTFHSDSPIESFTIKADGNNCDDCYKEIKIQGVEFEVEDVEYLCEEDKLAYSISGGSGSYRVYVGDDPTHKPEGLSKGEHIITFQDRESGCKEERSIQVDCCSSFEVYTPNVEYCVGENPMADIRMSGGSSPYKITIHQDGETIEEKTTGEPQLLIEIPSGINGNIEVDVVDDNGCESSDLFRTDTINPPSIVVEDNTYCSGDTEKDIVIEVGEESEVTITRGGVEVFSDVREGIFTVPLEISSSNNFTITAKTVSCTNTETFTLQELPCPDPIVNASDKTVCPGHPLVVTASIVSGTPGYEWVIKQNGNQIASGEGSNIEYDTGFIAIGTDFEYEITATDKQGKSDTNTQTIEVLPVDEYECTDCANKEDPGVEIKGGTSDTYEVGEIILLSHTDSSIDYSPYKWLKNGQVVGNQSYYHINADHQDIGTHEFKLQYEFEGCPFETPPKKITIKEEGCPNCQVSMRAVSGTGDLDGKIVTALNSILLGRTCVGRAINVEAIRSGDCNDSGNATINWTAKTEEKIGWNTETTVVKTDSGNTFTYTPTANDEGKRLVIEMENMDGGCNSSAQGLRVGVFESCTPPPPTPPVAPFEIRITDAPSTLCESDATNVPVTFQVRFGQTYGGYAPFSPVWKVEAGDFVRKGQKSVSSVENSFTFITTNVDFTQGTGTNRELKITVTRQWPEEATETITKTVRVYPTNSTQCTKCVERDLEINLDTPDQITISEGEYLSITANASSNLGSSFSYEWTGNGKIINNKTLTDSPTNDTSYTVVATDPEGCTVEKTVYVTVTPECKNVNPTLTVSYEGSGSQPYEVCPGDEITITTDHPYVTPVLFINGSSVPYDSGPGNTVTMEMPVSDITVKAEARYSSSCDKMSKTVTIKALEYCGCTLPSFGIDTPNGVCPGTPVDLKVLPNGQDDGYTYTWYDDPGYSNSVNTGEKYEGYTLSGYDPETVYVEATKSGCPPVRRAVQISPHGCGVAAGSISDKHIYHPSTGEVELTTFRFSVGAKCGIDSIGKLIATYSGGVTFDLKSYATITPTPNGNYAIEATFPPNSRVPACTNGSDTVEGVDAEFEMSGGGTCKLQRNFGRVCSETPGLSCNNC